MAENRLRQYCGRLWRIKRPDLRIFLAAVAMTLVAGKVHAQSAPDASAAWIGETGTATYYSNKYQGRRTALGTRFDQRLLTAAHAWLPLGTKVRVTLVATGESIVVTVTDRLRAKHCVIDLSTAAARMLGMLRGGHRQVVLSPAT